MEETNTNCKETAATFVVGESIKPSSKVNFGGFASWNILKKNNIQINKYNEHGCAFITQYEHICVHTWYIFTVHDRMSHLFEVIDKGRP